MQGNQLLPVPFYEDVVVLVDHDNQPFVAMKPVVENMGLSWQVQHRKLTEKFGSTITIMVTVGEDGRQREMVCLPLRKLPAWLYSIHANKVRPELREKITRYQSECDDALWDYWTKGSAVRAGTAQLTVPQLLATQRQVLALMRELKRETCPAIRHTLHAQLEQACRLLGIPAPTLEQIGADATPDHESPLLAEFWEIVDLLLQAPGCQLNHARNPGLIAFNLPQLRSAATAAKLALPEIGELRRVLKSSRAPRFFGTKAVNSLHTGGTVKCWVFDAGHEQEELALGHHTA